MGNPENPKRGCGGMVDAGDLKFPGHFGRAGSSPAFPTTIYFLSKGHRAI